ncbi:Hypothetical predicted protein [Octopus vulgaris]|uniref:Uncharacterized protein n=1 Tax=Octopus vulgaris TaxID=6645 RepID=A0AA36BLT7_OCTVU|nr:Hypothetical predicted protein [Octopus vulgaris]
MTTKKKEKEENKDEEDEEDEEEDEETRKVFRRVGAGERFELFGKYSSAALQRIANGRLGNTITVAVHGCIRSNLKKYISSNL